MSARLAITEMAHGIEMTAAHRAHASDMQFAGAVVENLRISSAENLAELVAVREALSKFDKNHPLLKNPELRKEIRQAGKRKYLEPGEKSWEEIAYASESVKYEYSPPVDATETANIQNLVEKHALRTALKRIDKNHPLIRPEPEQNMLVAALRKAGLMAYSFGGYEAVSEAGRTFKYPEDLVWGQKESVLEAYPGEIEALEKRLAYLRSPDTQRAFLALKAQAGKSPT